MSAPFPVGARVLVDGRNEAIVKAHFPAGSTSYAFAHYVLQWPGEFGERFVVHVARVGVDRIGGKS